MKKTLFLFTSLLISQLSISQNALDFDGTNDVVQTTYLGVTGSANRTFEAWIFISSSAPASNLCIMDYGVNAVGARNTFAITGTRGLSFLSGGTNANIGTGTNLVPVNQWAHVAFVLNNGTGYLYINGVQAGTGNLSNVNTPTTGTDLRIGDRVPGGNIRFKGAIDEVRVWDVARTQTEIASTMNTEFCAAPTTLKAYYKFNQGTAGGTNTAVTTATDDAGTNNGTLSGFALTGTTSNWVTGMNILPVTINSTFPITACGSYTMPNGTVITTAGTYFDTVGSSASCDSLDSYVITLAPATIKNVVADSGCATYTTPLGKMITTSGTYYDTVSTTGNCDTVIQYDIVVSGAVDDSVYRTGGRIDSWDSFANHQWVRCDSNFAPIVGETNRFIITTLPGDYAVIVSRGTCVDTSDCVNINPASISESVLNNSFEVFPNPASNLVTIKNLENITITGFTIIDVSGKIVLDETNNSNNVINVEGLENGVYFLQVKTTTGIAVMKFVKN